MPTARLTRCLIAVSTAVLAAIGLLGLLFNSGKQAGSPLTVLESMAASARDPVTVALVISGLVVVVMMTPLVRDRDRPTARRKLIEALQGKHRLAGLTRLTGESVATVLVLTIGTCVALRMATQTVRGLSADNVTIQTNTPRMVRSTFADIANEVKACLLLNDGSREMRIRDEEVLRCSRALADISSCLKNNRQALSEEDQARGWLLVTSLAAMLGEYEQAKDAIAALAELPDRFRQHRQKAATFFKMVAEARGRAIVDPGDDPSDVRASRMHEIERLVNAGGMDAALQKASEYTAFFADDERSGDLRLVLFLGDAYAYKAAALNSISPARTDEARSAAEHGLLLARIGRAASEIDPITRMDFDRLYAECKLALAECARRSAFNDQEAANLEEAARVLERLIFKDQKTGLASQALAVLDRLMVLYDIAGLTTVRDGVAQRRSALLVLTTGGKK